MGPSNSKKVLEQANIDPNVRAKDLSPEQLNAIIHAINANKIPIEGDLRREVQGNLKRLQAINCYRGIRHRRSLPVRGQRTSTNARTARDRARPWVFSATRTPKPAKSNPAFH
jgi:small subunit ribosomal protein S13